MSLTGDVPIPADSRLLLDPWLAAIESLGLTARWQHLARRTDLPDTAFSIQASAVFSAQIEGNSIDLNSYFRLKAEKSSFKATEQKEINALMTAYEWARSNPLNERNILAAHKLASTTILPKTQRGKYRTTSVGVGSRNGLIYMAVEPEHVAAQMAGLMAAVVRLGGQALTTEQAFYHAALVHLVFAHIHPFADGNGRMARLIEKWVLSIHLGPTAWKIPSEEYDQLHRAEYYATLALGPNFYTLDYGRAVPFLTMLPRSLTLLN